MDDLFIILDEPLLEGIKVRNKTPAILSANLDSYDENDQREAIIWGPRGRDDVRELSRDQLQSREIRKLLVAKPPKLEIRR